MSVEPKAADPQAETATPKSDNMMGNALLIDFDNENDVGYYSAVENNPMIFPFMGENPQEQLQRVQRLGELMQEFNANPEALLDELPTLLDWPATTPDGGVFTSQDMVETLFSDTTSLGYEDAVIYMAPEADVLLDVMEEAGAALLMML
jgi:hypothetical protein